jgi:predicted nucleotide-binding protein
MANRILFVDDDRLAAEPLCAALRDAGFVVDCVHTVAAALNQVEQARYDLAIVDVMMPAGGLGFVATKGGFETGIALARRLRAVSGEMKILGISQKETTAAVEWFETQADGWCLKSEALLNPQSLVRRVAGMLGRDGPVRLRVFVVHGHDTALRDELTHMLETEFGLSVVVLDRQAWRGRTVIEKLEDEAADVDAVFVLLTPDDFAIDRQNRVEERARPNVLIEIGYFFGRMSRRSGRVIMLSKGSVAIPSDLHGLGAIDVTDGLASARDAIGRELDLIVRGRRASGPPL